MSTERGKPRAFKQDGRDQRRAAALRENLRRRKAQARARMAEDAGMAGITETETAVSARTRETEP